MRERLNGLLSVCMGYSRLVTVQVSALRCSEASSPRKFSIMGSSIGGSGTVRSTEFYSVYTYIIQHNSYVYNNY